MKGLELSRLYFEEYGRKMLENKFAPYLDRIAAGLCGQGSERYGYDDDISKDHDYCAGFCLFISRKDDAEFGFELMKAYRSLPNEYMGVSAKERTRAGSSRYGVIITEDYFSNLVGARFENLTAEDYLYTPSYYFADATNGSIFMDKGGKFTDIYNRIKHGMPEDVRLKKLAACAAGMAQSGQYNYSRIISHGEQGASVFALCEFVKFACMFIHLLNKRHAPYYKWLLRSTAELELCSDLSPSLEFLLTADNEKSTCVTKAEIIEAVCMRFATELKNIGLSTSESTYLEDHAREITAKIKDNSIRQLHIMTGI